MIGLPFPLWLHFYSYHFQGFSGGSDSKESACSEDQEFDPWVGKITLERGKATHSRILAWKIPWAEEPDGLQLMSPQELEGMQKSKMAVWGGLTNSCKRREGKNKGEKEIY